MLPLKKNRKAKLGLSNRWSFYFLSGYNSKLSFFEGVSMDGKASTAINAFHTRAVSMALATNRGNVSVKPTGVANSAIKVGWI